MTRLSEELELLEKGRLPRLASSRKNIPAENTPQMAPYSKALLKALIPAPTPIRKKANPARRSKQYECGVYIQFD